ncbi:hypothetical protein [Mucilaginibacter aquariorum]|uniref:Uncharacterized protein n=1 Tax=Mucilaginibacter aquariorum TaxID=2967225 RepID=A0ABT1SZS7_9SPHI|nr:hypothetical protein [Mucilaginibacter aquariorum]MCQ6957718.1 hypothetical protein [Mucilaginibacter aquariorum]
MALKEEQLLAIKNNFNALITDNPANQLFRYDLREKQNEKLQSFVDSGQLNDKQSEEFLVIQLENTLENFRVLNKIAPNNELGVDFKPMIEKLTKLLNEHNE